MPKANLVYLTFNSSADVDFLPQLVGSAGEDLPVIAIDNASADDSAAKLAALGLEPKVMEENLGFTAGINCALANLVDHNASGAEPIEWAVIANPDVRAATQDWLPKLLDVPPKCGQVGARLSNGSRVVGGGNVTLRSQPVVRSVGRDVPGGRVLVDELLGWTRVIPHLGGPMDLQQARDVPWVPFALAALRMEMVQQIGLLDEAWWHFISDVEYGLRAWQHGWSVRYNPVTFYHDGGEALKTAPAEVSAWARDDIARWCRVEFEYLRASAWL